MNGLRVLLASVVAACLAAALVSVVLRPPAPSVAAEPRAPDAGPRLAALEEALERLTARLERLERAPTLPPPAARSEAAPARSDASPPRAVSAEEPTAAWFLEQYVRSFDTSSEGSEHYRRRVADRAAEIVGEIALVVLDRNAPIALRTRLVAILSDARFAGHTGAIEALLRCARESREDEEALCRAALRGLATIGDETTARSLEAVAWRLPTRATCTAAVATLAALLDDPNPALERLLGTAPDDEQRAALLELVDRAHLATALAVLQQATGGGVTVRLPAAQVAVALHGADARAFVDGWLGWERDGGVRRVLERGRPMMLDAPAYAPAQALGPPDAQLGRDDPRAWAYRETRGRHWIELEFAPRRAHALRMVVSYAPGGIARVVLHDQTGGELVVHDGADPCRSVGACEIAFPLTAARIRSARIELDADRVQSWCEIDAAELVGPDGSGWATGATASSFYGD